MVTEGIASIPMTSLTLELDPEAAGMLAGTLLAGDSCAVRVRHGERGSVLLCALPGRDGEGMRLQLRFPDQGAATWARK
ncbi:hypothetical protein C8E97_1746 [Saccharothrix australiensis]|uniref:Uncharacterized protein n=2 Tax=Saccharothrix australiensis TaxID=2072 RepID=A0A495VUU4_9PSEU|nr:hypothetical protein C8E97_1746 [Saccharothrix australiensis]